MKNEDDNDGDEWPPKRSGRRKIGDLPGSADDSERDEASRDAPPSERMKLPGGAELDAVMRQALDADSAPASVDVLRGVQDRLRKRSGGKFYSDGWSTTRHPPFGTFFVTSLMMIAIVAIIYAILVPLVGDPIELPRNPDPVQVLPPASPPSTR